MVDVKDGKALGLVLDIPQKDCLETYGLIELVPNSWEPDSPAIENQFSQRALAETEDDRNIRWNRWVEDWAIPNGFPEDCCDMQLVDHVVAAKTQQDAEFVSEFGYVGQLVDSFETSLRYGDLKVYVVLVNWGYG